MKVSVAMASYEGARFVGEQLESFRVQTRLPDELVVCDDGSTDGTPELVEAFAASAPFAVRVERNPERLGYTRNFERAVSLCSGEIICLSDQDDRWYPDKIERVLAELDAAPATLMTVNDQDIVLADARTSGATIFGNNRKLGFPDSNLIAGCCTSFRRPLLDLLLPVPEGIPYDSWFGTMADLLGVKKLIEAPLQMYRRHGGNTTDPIYADAAPGLFSLFRRFGLDDPRESWRRSLDILDLYAARIEERRGQAEALAGRDGMERALGRLEEEAARLRRRLELLALPRPARLVRVVKLWREGFYASQFGLKSAVKDAIRR
jgi:glycosyltransferase involved in cell wall biosynthesis